MSYKKSKIKRILINNYYDGVCERGVITFVRNICFYLDKECIEYRVFRCPSYLKNSKKHGFWFHLFEQVYIPILGLRYNVVLYPYNSISIFSIFHRGSLLIVHDFIQNRSKSPGYSKISAKIVRYTQFIYSIFHGNVAFITDVVLRQAQYIGFFKKSKKYLLPNIFYDFKKKAESIDVQQIENKIMLCTGFVPTKDFIGAIKLYQQSQALLEYELIVLGMGEKYSQAIEILKRYNISLNKIKILNTVSEQELIFLYKQSSIIWVHSLQEGFGRNLIEAYYCNKKVIASKITSFVVQAKKNKNIYLYQNDSPSEFNTALKAYLGSSFIKCDDVTCNLVFEKNIKHLLFS
ncbi:MAG: glycosyltransferase family 4 protein [Chlorobiaceae bacterium]|nr:glycosyltransferase family 4 protein [Chlorobiaceae bacterium]